MKYLKSRIFRYIAIGVLVLTVPLVLTKVGRHPQVIPKKLPATKAAKDLFFKFKNQSAPNRPFNYTFESWQQGRNDSDLAFIASHYDLLITDGYSYYNNKVSYLRSLNNNLIILTYKNGNAVTEGSDNWKEIVKNNPEWLLKDINNKPVYEVNFSFNKVLNPANPSYRAWLADKLKDQVVRYGYDGIYMDMVGAYIWVGKGGYSARPVNPATNKPFTDMEWLEANKLLLKSIKQGLDPRKIVIMNGFGTQNGANFKRWSTFKLLEEVDGSMMEFFLRWNSAGKPKRMAGDWFEDIEIVHKLISLGRVVMVQTPLVHNLNDQEFAMASFLIASGKKGFFRFQGGFRDYLPIYDLKIGQPISHIINKNGFYVRHFTNGKVFLNATKNNKVVKLTKKMKNINGQWVTKILLAPSSAKILLYD